MLLMGQFILANMAAVSVKRVTQTTTPRTRKEEAAFYHPQKRLFWRTEGIVMGLKGSGESERGKSSSSAALAAVIAVEIN